MSKLSLLEIARGKFPQSSATTSASTAAYSVKMRKSKVADKDNNPCLIADVYHRGALRNDIYVRTFYAATEGGGFKKLGWAIFKKQNGAWEAVEADDTFKKIISAVGPHLGEKAIEFQEVVGTAPDAI